MAAFPDINPSFSVIESVSFNTQIINYGNKIEQRVAINSLSQTTYTVHWRVLTSANKQLIQDFFIARKGAFEAFTWTNLLTDVVYNVRFKADIMSAEYFNYLLWSINEVAFLEVV